MAGIIAPEKPKGKRASRAKRLCPLFLHATGQWAKKIAGKMRYFGKDKDKALKLFADEYAPLLAGGEPRRGDKSTVRDLANLFLTNKKQEAAEGVIGQRHFDALHAVCKRIVLEFGPAARLADLGPADFLKLRTRLGRKLSLPSLAREIRCVRSVFKFADDTDLLARPVKFGPGMKLPNAKAMRMHREKNAPQLPTADELKALVKAAGVPLKAFILLGCNAAMGAGDISALPRHVVEDGITTGWLSFSRVKTGASRRCWLWTETRDALKVAMAKRKEPKIVEYQSLAFVTKYGAPYVRTVGESQVDGIGQEYSKLAKLQGVKRRRGFYLLRHLFADKAGETGLSAAVDLVMGHSISENDMSARYRHHVSDDQLKQVSAFVHDWIFSP